MAAVDNPAEWRSPFARARAQAARPDVRLYSGRQLVVTRTQLPRGLRFTGEIDASNVGAVTDALHAYRGVGDLHLDMSWLSFCDVSGIRVLVASAERRDRRNRLILHGLPAQLRRVLDVVGWGELPGLGFCDCSRAA